MKILNTTFLLASLILCSCTSNFNETDIYYKLVDEESNIYATFTNDSILLLNSEDLKPCGWQFVNLNKGENGLYSTNELKTDTMWVNSQDGILHIGTDQDEIMKFEKIKIETSKIDSIKREIEVIKNFNDKGIMFECEYSMKEVGDFYERSLSIVKSRLKNPNSAKFNQAYVKRYKSFNENNEYVNTTTTAVSLNVEAKNGFGNYGENEYTVFFIPNGNDNYETVFSESSLMNFESKKKLQFE
jgi:hypothetical protein